MDGRALEAAAIPAYLEGLQALIVGRLAALDGGRFREDAWQRGEDGALQGHGLTCMLEDGDLFERAAVGLSHVRGRQLPASASASRPEIAGRGFEASGLSLVMHPRNPYVPTVHMNVRFFVAKAAGGEAREVWWVGGGMDLTPCYPFAEDAIHFHRTCRAALDSVDPTLYPQFKAWCDRYFFLKHRNEARGIGGIFFDDFTAGGDFDRALEVLRRVGEHFLPAYEPIVARRRDHPFGERERAFQAYRRARYVEFNLVYDRGTLFGLQSGGRTESILMSMPPIAAWRYDWHPEPGTPEAELDEFIRPRDWL